MTQNEYSAKWYIITLIFFIAISVLAAYGLFLLVDHDARMHQDEEFINCLNSVGHSQKNITYRNSEEGFREAQKTCAFVYGEVEP